MNFQVSSKKDSVLIVRPVLQLFGFNWIPWRVHEPAHSAQSKA